MVAPIPSPNWPHSQNAVAICTVGELFGGVERHVLGLLDGLRQRGLDPALILFHEGELARQARAAGIEPRIVSASNLALPGTARELANLLRARGVRLVHTHGYKATVFCLAARRHFRFTLVKTEHGRPERIAGHPLQTVRERAYRWLDAAACRAAHATVAYVTDDLRRRFSIIHRGLARYTVPNGVAAPDTAGLQRPEPLARAGFHVVLVGRLDAVKGQAVAIDALARPDIDHDIQLHILGTGPLADRLRRRAIQRGIEERVQFHGFRSDVPAWMANADAIIMPSLHEGLPYTVLEAMALQRPIIASRVGGLREVLDTESAVLVPPGDAVALAAALERLRRSPDLRARLGTAAQAIQLRRYTLAAMTDHYLDIYAGALR